MTFVKLIRLPNLILIGLILALAKTQLVDPISEISGIKSCISSLHWWLIGAATVLIAASGNVVNDIFDQDIDRHNRPKKQIVGKAISEQQAWNLYYVLVSVGVGLGIYLCHLLGDISSALLFLLSAGGLYFYSYSYKRQFLIGNLVVAALAGIVPLLPLYFQAMCLPEVWVELPWVPILMAFGFFAFISTLIREIIKDMEDMHGDMRQRCRTLPIVLGLKGTKAVVSMLIFLLLGAIGWLQKAWLQQEDIVSFFYFLLMVQLPAVVVLYFVIKGKEPKHFHSASKFTKVLMLTGILYMVVFRLTLQ